MFDDLSADENRITHAGSAEPTVGAWVPLPDQPTAATERSSRDESERYRRARRRSRLASGALIVGSGAAAVTLAYQLLPPAPPPVGTVGTVASTGGVGTTAVSSTGTGPRVTRTVATTSASGVTTYTTTQVVNGRTVVTHVRHVSTSSYHDD